MVKYAGLVEVCVSRVWTTIYDKVWDLKAAAVACRQLGYSSYGKFVILATLLMLFSLYMQVLCLYTTVILKDIFHLELLISSVMGLKNKYLAVLTISTISNQVMRMQD